MAGIHKDLAKQSTDYPPSSINKDNRLNKSDILNLKDKSLIHRKLKHDSNSRNLHDVSLPSLSTSHKPESKFTVDRHSLAKISDINKPLDMTEHNIGKRNTQSELKMHPVKGKVQDDYSLGGAPRSRLTLHIGRGSQISIQTSLKDGSPEPRAKEP